MNELNFQKRSVDNIKAKTAKIDSFRGNKTNLVSKFLGVILSFALAFLLYSLYQEYSGLNEDEFKKATSDNSEQDQLKENAGKLIKQEKIEIEIANGYTDEPIKIRSTKLAPYTDVNFKIKKPDSSIYEFSATSKITGLIDIEIPKEALTLVGEYEVISTAPDYEDSNPQKFYLRPGKVSPEISEIKAKKSEEFINKGVEIEVTLFDKYKNPINNRNVTLVSTRLIHDSVEAQNETTDEKGKIKFLVKSTTPGKSSFLALDKEQGVTLEKKIDIVFKEEINDVQIEAQGEEGVSGTSETNLDEQVSIQSLLRSLIPKASAVTDEISYYTIEGPDTVIKGEEVSVLIKAMSSSNKIITDYTGKIKFSSSDSNSNLPEEYTFTVSDKGEHLFSVQFETEGGQSLIIEATNTASVRGEKQIMVKKGENDSSETISTPEILSPPKSAEGRETVLSSNQVDIAGKADANMTIEVYDDSLKIGEVISNDTGLFFFKTEPLVDGKHNLKVRALNSAGEYEESEPSTIIIDTTNPIVLKDAVSLSNKILKPGDSTTIIITSEPGLDSARAIINSTAIPLIEGVDPGVYTGEYLATDETGTFSIDIELKDAVSNPVTYTNQAELIVTLNPEDVMNEEMLQNNSADTGSRPGGGYPYPESSLSQNDTSPNTGPKENFLLVIILAVIGTLFIFRKKHT